MPAGAGRSRGSGATPPGRARPDPGARWATLRTGLGAAVVAALCWGTGAVVGFRGPAFAWIVHFLLMAWVSDALTAWRPSLRGSWFRVREWEPGLYRTLGIGGFAWLLRRSGWDRTLRRSFDGTRAGLAALEQDTRRSESGHLVVAAIGAGLVVVAAVDRAWDAVGWLAAAALLLHAHPVVLQRATRHRIARLRRRTAAADRSEQASARPPE